MNRRTFLANAGIASSLLGQAPGLHEVTIANLQSRMQSGELTAEKTAALYLERIDQIDRRGPALNAVIEINPDALDIARTLDAEYKSKGPRGPLHGVPILLKDNIDTNDRMQTTAGSLALKGAPTPSDAFLVTRLRAAGAVILGKANLSEWANFRSTHSTSGWSARGGQTKNPYALDRSPCGSSSGSGVAVSANLTLLAIGTETDGSVVCPASMNGIVGIKPTLGLVSRTGIIPIAHSQDTAGPMARTVRDAAILLTVMAGYDPKDPVTSAGAGKAPADYTSFLDPNGLRGARIGVARQYFDIGPTVTAIMNECIDMMKKAGAEIIDPTDLLSFESWRDTEGTVFLYEFKADLSRYLARRGAKVRSLADCIAFNRAHQAQEMPFFEQELMEQAQEKGPLTEKEYTNALADNRRLTQKEGIDAIFEQHKLDAIIGPTAGPAFLIDLVRGDRIGSGCASPPAVAGYPHITVPAGFKFGLPVGISFFGAPWSEPTLLKLAYAFEQMRAARQPPRYLVTADLYAEQ
jgi:amidase